MDATQWHPVGFQRDPLATRGWGTLIESVINQPITFEQLVARYNWLLIEQKGNQDQLEKGRDK